MEGGTMRVLLEPLDAPGRSGAESVAFVCALNEGLGERPIAKAASGGELSRLMLALKVELARHDAVPTLVFDEVDAGIGGQVADRVAEALGTVARDHQVLVITHLPQIAAAGSRHLVVAKGAEGGVAQADVQTAHGEDRVEEIARMLGGSPSTARRHAQEMLKS
jgi:DNA repair protein RecN (Recombination protein N)